MLEVEEFICFMILVYVLLLVQWYINRKKFYYCCNLVTFVFTVEYFYLSYFMLTCGNYEPINWLRALICLLAICYTFFHMFMRCGKDDTPLKFTFLKRVYYCFDKNIDVSKKLSCKRSVSVISSFTFTMIMFIIAYIFMDQIWYYISKPYQDFLVKHGIEYWPGGK